MQPTQQRPKAESIRVEELLQHAQRGRLRLPYFQTGLRWRREHVIELFDSVARGFPIGSLLLWERAAEAVSVNFGALRIEAPEHTNAWMIVDGQQRITTAVLCHFEEIEQAWYQNQIADELHAREAEFIQKHLVRIRDQFQLQRV
jgi:hypothetical protein